MTNMITGKPQRVGPWGIAWVLLKVLWMARQLMYVHLSDGFHILVCWMKSWMTTDQKKSIHVPVLPQSRLHAIPHFGRTESETRPISGDLLCWISSVRSVHTNIAQRNLNVTCRKEYTAIPLEAFTYNTVFLVSQVRDIYISSDAMKWIPQSNFFDSRHILQLWNFTHPSCTRWNSSIVRPFPNIVSTSMALLISCTWYWAQFCSRTCAIVGGVLTVASLLDSILFATGRALKKSAGSSSGNGYGGKLMWIWYIYATHT